MLNFYINLTHFDKFSPNWDESDSLLQVRCLLLVATHFKHLNYSFNVWAAAVWVFKGI